MSAHTLPSSAAKGYNKAAYCSRSDSMWRPPIVPALEKPPVVEDTPDTYCTVCKGPLLSLPKDLYGKIEPYAKTSCKHNLCSKCIDPFMLRQLSIHDNDIQIPRHKCQLCGKKYLQIFRPHEAGDSSAYPPFRPPSQTTVFGESGCFSYKGTDESELSESMQAAAKKMKDLHVDPVDMMAVMLIKFRGTTETKIPYSMKRFHDISDILDGVVL